MRDTWSRFVRDFADNTSAHGFGKAFTAKTTWQRIFWATLFLTGFIFSLVQTVRILDKFFRYPKNMIIDLEYMNAIKFPAVTICNKNPYSLTYLAENYQLESSVINTKEDFYDVYYEDGLDYSTDYFEVSFQEIYSAKSSVT